METSDKERIIYYDIIRIAACLLVITVHVSSNQLYSFSPKSFDYQVSQFYNTLSISAPAMFFMLSGALFLNLDAKDIPIKKLWGKYILRMVVSYVFWSYLYTFLIWLPYYSFSFETVKAYILEFFNGVPMYHMWFIPALISIYMVLPFLKPAFADKQRCKYYLCLFTVIQIVIPTVFKFDLPHENLFQVLYTKIPYLLCIGYVGYFILGYFLSTEEFGKKMRIVIYALGIMSLMAAVGIDGYLSARQNTAVLMFNDLFSLNSFLVVTAVFVAFRYIPWKTNKVTKAASKLSKLTFGIYLIHPLFMQMIFEHCPYLLEFSAIVWIPAIAVATFLCSAIVIWIISKIPIVNKYLI